MNWKEINNKYPKASNKWNDWSKNYPLQYVCSSDNELRILYDFFDEQGIYIFPLRGYYHFKGLGLGYEIQENRRHRQHGFKTRKETEQAAFEKAFEILENKLK